MAHVHATNEAHRNIPGRVFSCASLLLAVASLLIACGGPTPAGPASAANPPPPPPSGDTTPPTAPASLTATTNGPFAADLSWQPSTDNVGVTAYRVERCAGAGCSAFGPVATPTGTSFTDTGLAAATAYSYRVRATDAAANLSAPSNAANVTTAAAPTPPPAVLPAWVPATIGQWQEIPNTLLSSVDPSPVPSGNTGPQSKVIAWTSFAVDTRTSKVYSLANGGHTDYAGNEVDVLNLEVAQPAWSQILAPTPDAQLTNCQSYYLDDRPAARHSYYGVTLNDINDRFMLFAGANWCANGGFHNAISSYNIGMNTWSPSTAHGTVPGALAGSAAFSRDPATGNVYGTNNFVFGRWDRSTNAWTPLTPSGSGPVGTETMSAMDTARGRILFLGGLSSDHHHYTISSNSFTTIALTGANAANVAGAQKGALVYVDVLDLFLIRLDGPGGTVYQVNPITFEVTTFATTNGASIPATQNGPYNKFLYVPRLRGSIYVPSYSGNVWFLRVNN